MRDRPASFIFIAGLVLLDRIPLTSKDCVRKLPIWIVLREVLGTFNFVHLPDENFAVIRRRRQTQIRQRVPCRAINLLGMR